VCSESYITDSQRERERESHPKKMVSDRQQRRSNDQLVDRKSIKYNRSKNTYYFEIFYFNRGNSKRLRASWVDYPTKNAASADCERLAAMIRKTGKIRGFRPLQYSLRTCDSSTTEGIYIIIYIHIY